MSGEELSLGRDRQKYVNSLTKFTSIVNKKMKFLIHVFHVFQN